MFKIHDLFPTPVYETYLDRKITKKEIDYMNKVSKKIQPNTGNTASADKHVLEGKPMSNLKKFILTHIDNYFEEIIHSCSDMKPYITQSWLNYTKPNQYHHTHEHENSMVSGVFYVNADKDKDSIRFYKTGYQQIKPTIKEYNLYNSTSWYVPAETGKLILFPSYLSHCVDEKEGNNLRVSLAFNVFIRGTVGTEINLTKLELR